MKTIHSSRNIITAIALAVSVTATLVTGIPGRAEEPSRAETIKNTLKGKPTYRTRGFTSRGQTPTPARTRTLYVSRGIASRGATAQKAFFEDEKTTVTEVKAPSYNPNTGSKGDLGVSAGEDAYKVEYKVDPTSKLRGEVFFEKGTAAIRKGHGFLEDLATALKDPVLKDDKFVIEGHASADGSAVSNKILSQERANRIHDMLIRNGVKSNQIFPAGYGEDEARFPVDSPEKTLAQDRRVLIYRLED